MVAAIGLASTAVSVLARSSSTQENMKQKNAATPTPAAMVGMKMRMKNRQNGYPSTKAVSSSSFGTPDMNPSRIHTASGMLNRQCGSATTTEVTVFISTYPSEFRYPPYQVGSVKILR